MNDQQPNPYKPSELTNIDGSPNAFAWMALELERRYDVTRGLEEIKSMKKR